MAIEPAGCLIKAEYNRSVNDLVRDVLQLIEFTSSKKKKFYNINAMGDVHYTKSPCQYVTLIPKRTEKNLRAFAESPYYLGYDGSHVLIDLGLSDLDDPDIRMDKGILKLHIQSFTTITSSEQCYRYMETDEKYILAKMIHPHILQTVCFGDVDSVAKRALGEGDLFAYRFAVMSAYNTYYEGSSFCQVYIEGKHYYPRYGTDQIDTINEMKNVYDLTGCTPIELLNITFSDAMNKRIQERLTFCHKRYIPDTLALFEDVLLNPEFDRRALFNTYSLDGNAVGRNMNDDDYIFCSQAISSNYVIRHLKNSSIFYKLMGLEKNKRIAWSKLKLDDNIFTEKYYWAIAIQAVAYINRFIKDAQNVKINYPDRLTDKNRLLLENLPRIRVVWASLVQDGVRRKWLSEASRVNILRDFRFGE